MGSSCPPTSLGLGPLPTEVKSLLGAVTPNLESRKTFLHLGSQLESGISHLLPHKECPDAAGVKTGEMRHGHRGDPHLDLQSSELSTAN